MNRERATDDVRLKRLVFSLDDVGLATLWLVLERQAASGAMSSDAIALAGVVAREQGKRAVKVEL